MFTEAIAQVKGFEYGKEEATFGFHHFVELQMMEDAKVECTLFLHTGSIHKSHEFSTTLQDLQDFMTYKSTNFEDCLHN